MVDKALSKAGWQNCQDVLSSEKSFRRLSVLWFQRKNCLKPAGHRP